MSESRVMWDRVAMVAVVVLAIVLAVWWLESRFGALIAVMSIGLLSGAAFFMLGAVFNQRQSKNTMENVGDFLHEMMQVEKQRSGVNRVYAQMERDAAKASLTGVTLEAKRVDQIAQQRAKLLVSESRQQDTGDFWDSSDIEYIEVE